MFKAGDKVLIMTEDELWKLYPSRIMPCGLAVEMKRMLGGVFEIEYVSGYNDSVSIKGWSWPIAVIRLATTPKGNQL
jgi:hypothetical protein